jgi:hypothetical protein
MEHNFYIDGKVYLGLKLRGVEQCFSTGES